MAGWFRVLFLVLTCILSASTVGAAPKSVQVVAIYSEDAFQNAQALTDALRGAVERREGFVLAKGEYSLEVMSAALSCPDPPDPACLQKIAKKMQADRYIWGTLRKQSNRLVSARLNYWEDGTNQRDVTIDYSANLTDASDETLSKIAEDALGKLVGEAEGTLVIRAGTLNGTVFVNDVERGKLVGGEAELTLPAGDVQVRVVVEGYRDSLASARVPAGDTEEVHLEPVPTSQPEATDRQKDRKKVAVPPGTSRVAAYTVLGIGAAVTVAGGVLWYMSYAQQQDQAYQEYRAQVPVGDDACEAARDANRQDIVDLCNKNGVTRVLAMVLTPVGLAVTGLAGVLLATSESKGSSAMGAVRRRTRASRTIPGAQVGPLQVSPLLGIGPYGGRLDVRVSF
jgi:hypothetical protein